MAVRAEPQVGSSEDEPGPDRLRLLRFVARQPWLITAVLCAILLALPRTGGDLAAQEFHTWVLRQHGALLWNNYWYGGHLLGGYSLLFPPLGAVVGTRLLGALAAVGAAAAANALFGGRTADRGGRIASIWFAIGVLSPYVVGQVPFGVGVAFGLAALLAAARGHPWLAGLAALAASLTSPLAGAFLVMVAIGWAVQTGVRRVAPIATAALGIGVASILGGGGFFPFPRRALAILLLFSLGGLLLPPRGSKISRAVRASMVLYGASSIAIWAVHNPVGGNMTRLGALVGGPLAAALLLSRQGFSWRRGVTFGVVAVPLLAWQMWPGVTALERTSNDPSSHASYYSGLDAFLRTQNPAQGRVEIPTLRQHWESYYVPQVFPISRGWERQIDLRYNEILYHPNLTADQLHAWMVSAGVGLVAVPDAPMDYWSQWEVNIIRAGQPWLKPVWSDAHWQVWRLTDGLGLTTGPAQLTKLTVASFDLDATQAGSTVVRVHWSPFWRVTAGAACVQPGPNGWVTVRAKAAGPVTVSARWSLTAALRPSSSPTRC